MLKDPYTGLMELFKSAYEKDIEQLNFFFDFSDKFMTWLIGFGVAGISLIIANYDKLIANNFGGIKAIVLLLSINTIFGLLYRITSYSYIVKVKKLDHYFTGFFGELEVESVKASDISQAGIAEMLKLIEFEFDKRPEDFNPKGEPLELEYLKQYYLSLVEFAQKKFYIAANSIANTFEEAYGIKKSKTMDLLETSFGLKEGVLKNTGFKAKNWINATSFFYLAAIISFILCVVVVCLGVLFK